MHKIIYKLLKLIYKQYINKCKRGLRRKECNNIYSYQKTN